MKEKIKEWIFIGFVFLATVICILAISAYTNAVVYIELSDDSNNLEKVMKLENELETLESNECTMLIKKWIQIYIDNTYENSITIDTMWKNWRNGNPFTYKEIEKCVSDDSLKNNYIKRMISVTTIFYDGILDKYKNQYHLTFNRPMITHVNTDRYLYNSYRYGILDIIEELVDIEKEKVGELNVELNEQE